MSKSTRVAEFSSAEVPLDEIDAYLSVRDCKPPKDRPYMWTSSVMSLDGISGIEEPDTTQANAIALSHLNVPGRVADWRLLVAGWTYADAVIMTRTEPNTQFNIGFEDLRTFRLNVLKKVRPLPLQVVLTSKGDLDLSVPKYTGENLETLIVTTAVGFKKLIQNVTTYVKGDKLSQDEVLKKLVAMNNTRIKVLEANEDGGVDIPVFCKYMRVEEHIEYMACPVGSTLLAQFYKHKAIDETRFTYSGCIFGAMNSVGKQRLHYLDKSVNYTVATHPLYTFKYVRIYGDHHVFMRGSWEYRH